MKFIGTYSVTGKGEQYDNHEGISLSRANLDKTYVGPLNATSKVQMLAVHTAHAGSAGVVALERVTGELDGKVGSFVLLHLSLQNRHVHSSQICIVADSGTGALAGIRGSMTLEVDDCTQFYQLDCALD
jgi:hypothetical protein